MDEFSAQTKLLCKHRIETKEQLVDFISGLEYEKGMLIAERKAIRYSKHQADKVELEDNAEAAKSIDGRLLEVRKYLKLTNLILDRSEDVEEKLLKITENKRRQEGVSLNQHHISWQYCKYH